MLQKLFKLVAKRQSAADSFASPFALGESVYILQQYYVDYNTTPVEIPRFDWRVTQFDGGLVQIEARNKRVPVSMHLKIEPKYLKREQ
jgi:hypothetical protein